MQLHKFTYILVIIGGLNWLLIGLFKFDLVMTVLGFMPFLVNLVYILVGLSAVYEIVGHKKMCKDCDTMGTGSKASGAGM